jgi:Holliday junction resolvase RusA-like endonuclease
MKLMFKIRCNPPKATSQQKGMMIVNGKPLYFKKKHVKAAEDFMLVMLQEHRPERPFAGPLTLAIRWTYPWRSSEKKANLCRGWMPCDKRPDCSNLVKMFEDCLKTLDFFTDDSQVADLRFIKGWGDNPGIEVLIENWQYKDELI